MNYDTVNIVSFPLDHIYAIANNSAPTAPLEDGDRDEVVHLRTALADTKREISKLKHLVQAHLDLIQKQNDLIIERDKLITLYKEHNDQLKIRLERFDRRNKTQCQRNPPPLIHIPSGNQKTTSLAITPGALAKTKLSEFPDRITTTAGSTAGIIFIRKPPLKQETMTVSPRDDMKNSKGNVSVNSRRVEESVETFRKNLNTQPITYSKKSHLPTINAPEQTQMTITSQSTKIDLPSLHVPVSSNKPNSFNSKCKMIYSYNIKQGPDNRINVKETKTFGKPYDFCNQTSMLLDHLSDNQTDQSITLHKGFQDSTAKSTILIPSNTIKMEEIEAACSSSTNYQSNSTNKSDNTYSKKTLTDSGNKLKLKRNNTKKKPLSNIKVRNNNLDLSRIKEESSLGNENNFFASWTMNKKIETSCRDFSYGETINNINTSIIPSIDRENRETNSLIRGLYMADDDDDDELFFKQKCSNKDMKISNVSISDSQSLNTTVSKKNDRAIKPKKKSTKRSRKRTTVGKVENTPRASDPNLLVRGMFMADEFSENDKKRDRVPLFFGEDSILDGFSESNQGGIPDEKTKLTFTCYSDPNDKKDLNAIGKKKDYLSAFFGSDSSPDVYELNINEPIKNDKSKRRFGCFSEKKESTIIRKRTFSTCSRSSVTSQSEIPNSNVRAFAACQFKALTPDSRPLTMLTTDEHYHTNMNAPPPQIVPSDNSAFLEVPSWRITNDNTQSKEDSSEEVECLDDAIFMKRHSKMEIDEKRIKRRDYQRLKEQELLKKLKERQEKTNFISKKITSQKLKPASCVPSLWPSIEDAQFIQVEETIPVAAFGEFIPNFGKRAFSLPWLHHEEPKRSSRSKQKLKRD